MAHYVICPKCGQKFDRDKIQTIQISARRYGHASCYPGVENFIPPVKKEISEEQKIKNYAKSILKDTYNARKINKQIKDYLAEGYTASGILKTLTYWYDIKHNNIDKALGGIGIVPYVYKDAENYYYNMYIAEMINVDKDISDYTSAETVVNIDLPTSKERIKLFDMGDEDE